MRKLLSLLPVFLLTLFLAACDSAEERAEEHYQNALSLLAEDDVDRAIVELRNVFTLVPTHLEARRELARIFRDVKRSPQQAYRQYLRLVEQYPDDTEARIELAEMAFFGGNWDEMERHGERAAELDPENPRVHIISAALAYRAAVENDDNAVLREASRNAMALLDPSNPSRILRELALDDNLRNQKFTEALAALDGFTEEFPNNQRYWMQRLQVLLALGDDSAVEEQLVDMVERFPDNVENKQTLIRYFLSRGELDKTEAFLRQQAEDAPDGEIGPRVDLIRFIIELRSVADARAEIAAAIETETDKVPFIMLGAALDFSSGNVDQAIADLEAAIEDAPASEQTNDMKISLARMHQATGNEVGARALVEAVLLEDPTQVGALKMNAGWLIEADETDAAIGALRAALDKAPEDVEALTLTAAAYARTGSSDLSRDFLALAAEASGNAPAETIRYAQTLIAEGRYLPAEDVLLPALRIAPNNLDLLRAAAQLYLEMGDMGRTQQVIDTLRRIETPEASQLAVVLEAARLDRASGTEEALGYLESLSAGADADAAARILLLRARLSGGDTEGAIELAEAIAADQPDQPSARLVLATTLAATGELERALEIYRGLIEEYPNEAGIQVEISTLLTRMGQPDEARETIAAALEINPEDPRLLWASASFLESDGDIDGAIAVYEEMYALDSSNIVVANNLASLLATYRDDDASLDLAWTIARRFRDFDLPQVQDTYGWITFRRGDYEDALPYLETAAAALGNDPIVQFHLAEVLFALDRKEDALEQYRASLEQAGVGDTRPQMAIAQQRILELQDALANPSE